MPLSTTSGWEIKKRSFQLPFDRRLAAPLFDKVGNCEISATYDVPIRRFDQSFGAFARPALCKIDVQGAELMVIEGMG